MNYSTFFYKRTNCNSTRIISGVLLSLLFSCGSKSKEITTEQVLNEHVVTMTDAQLKNAGIEMEKMEIRTIASMFRVNGRIDVPPQNMVSISVPLGGYLKSSKLLPGMRVNKGEVLAVMEDQQYIQLQQDYLMAKTKLAFMESEYNRQRELNQSKATSDKVFQQVESDYKIQRILVKALYEKLILIGIDPDTLDENTMSRSITITSPISGYVSNVNVNIGKYANPADVLFEIVNPADIHLALNVFEKDVDKLFVGQKVIAYTNANPNKKYLCTIILIGRDISADRSAEVHCHFEQYDKILIPGMFMNSEIETKSNRSYALPVDALVRFANKQYVFISTTKNTFELVEVQAGETENEYTEITIDETLAENQFVIKGAYTLLMKMKNTSEE
jgi:membrane fusion protein, heavy metal efflux system